MADLSISRRFQLAVDPARPPEDLAGAVFAIGNFDGVHRGHKAVLQRARTIADSRGAPAAVLTFEPHPSDYFGGPGTIFRLTPLAMKARLMERLGMDGMVVLHFDAAMADMTADAFVSDILIARLGAGAVVAGYDFHFGKLRGGTPAFLRAAGVAHGFGVEIVEKIGTDDGSDIASSTATRVALEAGDVALAARLLGHPYAIAGIVLPGQRLGRTLGFPTANIQADPSCRLRYGIYAVQAEVGGTTYNGVASWGRRPTVDNGAALLEVFLFDMSGDLYGQLMDVAFVAWLRAEERFDSIKAMTRQIGADVLDARAALAAASVSPTIAR